TQCGALDRYAFDVLPDEPSGPISQHDRAAEAGRFVAAGTIGTQSVRCGPRPIVSGIESGLGRDDTASGGKDRWWRSPISMSASSGCGMHPADRSRECPKSVAGAESPKAERDCDSNRAGRQLDAFVPADYHRESSPCHNQCGSGADFMLGVAEGSRGSPSPCD